MALSLSTTVALIGCSNDLGSDPAEEPLRLAIDAAPVTSVDDALSGVMIPPYVNCQAPLDDVEGMSEGGQVCTPVSISGATEPGRRFADYADCEVVLTQRPYWPADPATEVKPNDPRLNDEAFAAELAWAEEQIRASGCACCHDSQSTSWEPSQWDIGAGGVWLDTLSDSGLALFAGLADSFVLGAYPPEEANGFARELTGVPSTDPERMRALMFTELEHRGITHEEAAMAPPFGGPLYAISISVPDPCGSGEGVDPRGIVHWNGGDARYIYVQEEDAKSPGVPPNLDRPEGTIWRLDVPPDEEPVESGITYGVTPSGTLQSIPERSAAPPLEEGVTYKLFVYYDVGLSLANCTFEFGEEI